MFYDKTVLPNGVTIVSETMRAVRSVAIGVWLTVGSRDEAPADAGMSHFMEHMMFKGTPTRTAAEISQVLPTRRGAQRLYEQRGDLLLRARPRRARRHRCRSAL
jgi:predicted Zn-dependent peptidase